MSISNPFIPDAQATGFGTKIPAQIQIRKLRHDLGKDTRNWKLGKKG